MTTNLDRLIEAVEAGESIKMTLVIQSNVVRWGSLVLSSFDGSLDAAVALLEALLPGWEFKIGLTNAIVWKRTHKGNDPRAVGASEITSRALLLATLRAYRSTREESPS